MAGISFSGLNKLDNLQVRVFKGSKKRRVGDAREDAISDALAKCQTAAEIAEYANSEGVPEARIRDLAKRSGNVGQFRMTMGNLVRGVYARVEAAKSRGFKLTKEQCGTKESMRAAIKALQPAKEPKAAAAKAPAKGKAPKGGKAAAKDPAFRGGAPSKQEAAARGKGGKKKAAKTSADGGGSAPAEDVGTAGVAETGGADVPGQQTLESVVG